MLRFGTEQYIKATEFIKLGIVTNDTLLELYLLHKRAEQEKSLMMTKEHLYHTI